MISESEDGNWGMSEKDGGQYGPGGEKEDELSDISENSHDEDDDSEPDDDPNGSPKKNKKKKDKVKKKKRKAEAELLAAA
jgi:hypothetical protein